MKNLVFEILRYAQNDNVTCLIAIWYKGVRPAFNPQTRPIPTPAPQNEVKFLLQAIRDELLTMKEMLE